MKIWMVLALQVTTAIVLAGAASAATDMDAVLRRLEALEKSNVELKQQNATLRSRVQTLEGRKVAAAYVEPVGRQMSAAPVAATTRAIPLPRMPDWNGFNIGVFSGYGLGGHWKGTADDYPHAPVNGWLGGASVAYNWQSANLVVGVEADVAAADIKNTDNYFDSAATLKIDYLGTVRGRIGYAAGRNLIYATGGLAWGHLDVLINHWGNPPGSLVFQTSADRLHLGYAVGGGVQRQLVENVSFKVEYLWVDLGEKNYVFPTPPAFAGSNTGRAGWSGHIVKAGLNWLFD